MTLRTLHAAWAIAAAPLIGWIQDSPALRCVRLRRTKASSDQQRFCQPCPEVVVRTVLRAMAKNPHIRELHSCPYYFTWPSLTEYFKRNKLLETLWLERSLILERAPDLVATAQAIEATSALKELSLPFEEEFLHLLQSHSTLRKLRLISAYGDPALNTKMGSVSTAMMKYTNLTHFILVGLITDRDCWSLLESGFRANPSIAHFQLAGCILKEEAADLLFSYLRGSDVNVQPVRNLELVDSTCGRTVHNADTVTKLAEMLRGSLLDHISFCASRLDLAGSAAFFNHLKAHTYEVRVRSMHLNSIKCGTFKHIGQYIPTVVHLRKLALVWDYVHLTYLRERELDPQKARVPNVFLLGLRDNGSLRNVQIHIIGKDSYHRKTSRFINAYTKRNRRLPQALKNLFLRRRAVKKIHADSPLEPLPSLSLVPTLCKAAMQAERMAPNTVLRGLTAGLEEIGRSNDQSTPLHSDRAAGSTST